MSDKKRFDVAVFLLGFFAFWVNGDNYAAAPLLVRIASDLRVDIGTAALSVTFYMLFFGLLTILFGPLGDRYGKMPVLKAAALGSALFSLLSAFAWGLVPLVVARAVNGAFSAGIMPVAVAYLGETSFPQTRQSRIAGMMGMMFLGGALSTAIGGSLAHLGSWQLVYFVYGVAELLLVLPLFLLLPAGKTKSADAGILPAYQEVLSRPGLRTTISLLFFVGFSTLGTFVYLGEFLRRRTGYNLMLVGCLLSAYGIGTLFGGRVAGKWRAALGRRFFLLVGAGGGAALLALGIAGGSPLVALPALFLYGMGFICMQSSIITTAQDLAPTRRGTVMSTASFTMVVSGALGTFINGRIWALAGDRLLLILAAIAFATAAMLASVLPALARGPAAQTAQSRPGSLRPSASAGDEVRDPLHPTLPAGQAVDRAP